MLKKPTVIVLDNAKVHQCKAVQDRQKGWATRGLFIFYLPPYSLQMNIIEWLWKEMKARWLIPKDYDDEQQLHYSTQIILAAIGKDLFLYFNSSIS